MKKLLYVIYYIFISKLPNSRFSMLFNKIRVWYASKIMKIMNGGEHAFLEDNVYIGKPGSVQMGKDCQINENVFLQKVKIGNYVMIGPGTSVLANSHKHESTDIPMVLQGKIKGEEVIIEDDVWIGRNVVIMHGIKIKKGAIIGAGAVVTKDVEEYSIMGGIPAKLIRKRK